MRETWLRIAAVLILSAASFAGTSRLSRPSPSEGLRRVLERVESDTAATVCAGRAPCLRADAEYTLLVFFSARDCSISLFDTVVLDSVFRAHPRARLNVVGVGYDLTPAEARAFAASSGISYPIYAAPERLKPFMRNPRPEVGNKPVKVLLSRDGRVARSATSRTTVQRHHQAAARLLGPLR